MYTLWYQAWIYKWSNDIKKKILKKMVCYWLVLLVCLLSELRWWYSIFRERACGTCVDPMAARCHLGPEKKNASASVPSPFLPAAKVHFPNKYKHFLGRKSKKKRETNGAQHESIERERKMSKFIKAKFQLGGLLQHARHVHTGAIFCVNKHIQPSVFPLFFKKRVPHEKLPYKHALPSNLDQNYGFSKLFTTGKIKYTLAF